ncbi:APC family permease [Alteromonas sp. 5E99-2]|uniref:amino acid permease n=1 Tax=Alteromonas sp. 5E99-2 TaxID=2817683 RepID=UPI001A99FB8E|nr:APC family permease [Alteromonas sp. 5E99-2]
MTNSPVRNSKKQTKLGLIAMMAICVGLVIVQGSMISALQGIGIGGSAFILAMCCALVIAQCNAMSFSELALIFPQEGSLAVYTQKAIGHFPAIVAVFSGYVVVAILAMPVEMLLVEAILQQLFPSAEYIKLVPIIMLGTLTFTNLIGADVFSKIQNVLSFVLISALVIVGVVAVTGLTNAASLANPKDIFNFTQAINGEFIGLIGLAMWMMVGVEFICPMITQVKSPTVNIPRSMQLSLLVIFAVFVTFTFGATRYVTDETLMNSPLPYLDFTQAIMGDIGLIVAAVLALTATCSTINTVLASVPRMLHGMAEQGQVFPQLKVSNRFGTPWLATVGLALCAMVPFLAFGIESLLVLVIAATTSWLLAYIVAHINVIVLRRRQPNLDRPFKTPLYPLPQIIGILAMVYVALNNSPDPAMTHQVYAITGGILFVVSVIAALWVKFYMKRNLFSPD